MKTVSTYEARKHEARPAGAGAAQDDLVLSFVGRQASLQKAGMTFPQDLSERSWERIGSSLRELSNSSAWWLADWLIFGESAFGWRRYREAIDRTGLDYQTLRNYAWVGRRFEPHRRQESLSFAHHSEVARMAPHEQDYWLRQADRQKWSRNELRKAVRASLTEQCNDTGAALGATEDGHDVARSADQAGPEKKPTGPATRLPKVATLTIELSAGQLDKYSKVAAAHGLPVDKWVTRMLDDADRRSA